jgi:hypothetical protein
MKQSTQELTQELQLLEMRMKTLQYAIGKLEKHEAYALLEELWDLEIDRASLVLLYKQLN